VAKIGKQIKDIKCDYWQILGNVEEL